MHSDTVPPLVRGLLVVTAALWLVAELRQSAQQRPEGRRSDEGSRMAIGIGSLAGVLAAVAASHAAPGATIGSRASSASIGLVVLWCGIGLRLWSFRTLGRYFTFTVQTSADQPVITEGPYRVVRHPGYAAVLVAMIGVGLIIGNWVSLVALTVCVAAGIVYRIRVEERALLRDIGEPYRAYAATHKRLVPFVW